MVTADMITTMAMPGTGTETRPITGSCSISATTMNIMAKS